MDATGGRGRAFVDLHCHTSASFDSLASPRSVVRAAASRGLTHLAITDHDRIEGALKAREIAAAEGWPLTILIGQEIKTRDGDLIGVFLERPIRSGLGAFGDDRRGPGAGRPRRDPASIRPLPRLLAGGGGMDGLAPLVDWVEATTPGS